MRENLKNARLSSGMTQKQVSEHLGINTRAYQYIESGRTLGKVTHWDRLEDLFNVPQRVLREMSEHDQQDNL